MVNSLELPRIIRSRRRSLALEIKADASVVVRAPHHVSVHIIEQFVASRRAWIEAKQRLMSQRQRQPKQYTEGETFLWLGVAYPLHLVARQRPALSFKAGFTLSQPARGRAKQLFIQWYKKQGRDIIVPRVQQYAALAQVTYGRVSITSATTRWGSCSATGNLNFSWRLFMAPPAIIDYVVAHEVAHRLVKNHSRHFWQTVSRLYPNVQVARAWLKKQGHTLTLG